MCIFGMVGIPGISRSRDQTCCWTQCNVQANTLNEELSSLNGKKERESWGVGEL